MDVGHELNEVLIVSDGRVQGKFAWHVPAGVPKVPPVQLMVREPEGEKYDWQVGVHDWPLGVEDRHALEYTVDEVSTGRAHGF